MAPPPTSSLDPAQRSTLLRAALDARSLSYSPYSKFRVGAAILLADGRILKGANVENASYGATVCAERTLLCAYLTSGSYQPRQIVALAVASDLTTPCSPCGICRQFIREFCSLDMPVLMVHADWSEQQQKEEQTAGQDKVTVRSLGELLPLSFGPEDLDKPRDGA